MRMKKYISLFAAAALVLAGCGEKEQPQVVDNSSVDLSELSVVAGPEGGEFSVNVTSSEAWRVSGLCDWVTLAAESGASGEPLRLTVAPNPGEKVRTAVFKVFAGSAVKALTVTSNPSFVIKLVGDEAVSIASDATHFTVSVKSNVEDFHIQTPDWIVAGDVQEALGKKFFSFDAKRSSEFKARQGQIVISADAVAEPIQVDVTQAQRDTAFVEGEKSIVKGLEAMDLTLKVRSNIDVTYSLPSWLTETSSDEDPTDDTGLKTRTIGLHADACGGSRAATVKFVRGSVTYGSVYIKQQNPNPVFTTIPDANLASILEKNGWILADPNTGKSEILEDGLNATSLTLGTMSNSYSQTTLSSIEGLEGFPKLETLNIGNTTIQKVDVSAFPALTSLTLLSNRPLSEVNLGDRPVTTLSCKSSGYGYSTAKDVVFKGTQVTSIDFSGASSYIGYGYETSLESVDVTGCPALTTLNTRRVSSSSWYTQETSLAKIYVTAAQKDVLTVTKNDHTEIVVK